jgi:PAS domain S-box-containing protein
MVCATTYEFGRYGDPTQPIAIRMIAAQISMLGTTLAALALAALFAERRRSEAALRESDKRLRSSLDAANVIAWDVDLTSDTVHSAGPVARLLHRPEGSVPGNFAAAVETIHPDDRDSVMAQFWTAVSTAAAYRLEFRLNSDGLRWVTAEGAIERDADGRPVRVRGITQDITERKKAEEKLRKSESEMRGLLGALAERNTQFALAEKPALVGSFAYDVGTDTLQISDGYAAIHGFPNETKEIARSRWLAGVHPEDRARLDELRSRAFRTRSPEYTADFRIVRPGGEVRWIEGRAFVAFRDDGRPQRVAGVNIDVTERKRAEAALEESRARYRALYDDNPSMYFTLDAVGTVLSVNEFGAQQLGYTAAELVGQSVLEVVHEGDREEARRWLASCAEKNAGMIATTEMRKVRRDGSTMWVREVARAVQGFGGQALIIVCEDITERKSVEEQQAKLVAELDHRVKNVLATVQAVADHTMRTSSSMEHFVAALDGRIRSMGSTHELLSHRRWLGIPMVELVERELAPYTTGSNTEIGGPEVMLSAEAGQAMGMMLHELATNAAKHGALSTPSGRVSIRWRLPLNGSARDRLVFTWRETGGPLVVPPCKSNYGMQVVRELVPYELGGTVDHVLAPEGVRCQMEIPLARLSRGGSQDNGFASTYSFHAPTTLGERGQVEA